MKEISRLLLNRALAELKIIRADVAVVQSNEPTRTQGGIATAVGYELNMLDNKLDDCEFAINNILKSE